MYMFSDFLEIEERFEVDVYAQTYGEPYIQKMKYLKELILEQETGEDKFFVIDLESGLGKSVGTDEIVLNYTYDNTHNKKQRKFLIVKRFTSEIENSVGNREEGLIGAIDGIDSESWEQQWKNKLEELEKIDILYITHQRYIDLCENEEYRNAICAGRHTLIIDEKINFPSFTFNKNVYDEIRAYLERSIQVMHDEVCKNLLDIIQDNEDEKITNKCVRVKPCINQQQLNDFITVLQANPLRKGRNRIDWFIKGLTLWYSTTTTCLYNSGNISTVNPAHRHWGLQNNIILDASGNIDYIYKVNPLEYNLIHQQRLVDHSHANFYHVDFNSSKSNLEKYEKEISIELPKKIKSYRRNHLDKTLIICHKDKVEMVRKSLYKVFPSEMIWVDKKEKDEPDYMGQEIAIAWYGNLIGKNTFREFTQVWLIGTPNIPYEQYPLQYMIYSKQGLKNNSLEVYKGRFKNGKFKNIQTGYIATEMYQSIKRIQRNELPKGDFFIMTHDFEIVGKILKEIKGAKITETIEFDFVREKKLKEKKKTQVERFIEYTSTLPPGEYTKREIQDALNLTNLSRLLRDKKVQALQIRKEIKINNKTIELLK